MEDKKKATIHLQYLGVTGNQLKDVVGLYNKTELVGFYFMDCSSTGTKHLDFPHEVPRRSLLDPSTLAG